MAIRNWVCRYCWQSHPFPGKTSGGHRHKAKYTEWGTSSWLEGGSERVLWVNDDRGLSRCCVCGRWAIIVPTAHETLQYDFQRVGQPAGKMYQRLFPDPAYDERDSDD